MIKEYSLLKYNSYAGTKWRKKIHYLNVAATKVLLLMLLIRINSTPYPGSFLVGTMGNTNN